MNSVVPPTQDQVTQALKTLRDQWLYVYQQLYPKWTQPGDGGFYGVHREMRQGQVSSIIKVFNRARPEYTFFVRTVPDDSILEKIDLIEQAIQENRKKIDTRACCPLAERRSCVCEISFSCPLHGTQCIGSHD